MELADWHTWWKRSGAPDLRRILMEEWDPIGVRGVPEAADEYDSYLPQIGSRLHDGRNNGLILLGGEVIAFHLLSQIAS